MNHLTWEQKLEALQALAPDAHVAMRKPGDWYVASRADVGGDGFITGKYGEGTTPELAVLDTWRELVSDLKPGMWLTPDGGKTCWRWNGYRWEDITARAERRFPSQRT